MTTVSGVTTSEAVEALTGRLFVEGVGAMHMATLYLGHKLGLYATLVEDGPLTAAELASRCGSRLVRREWLQAEATAGLVLADDEDLHHARFTAAPGVRETLVDETGPAYLGGLRPRRRRPGSVLPQLLAAFRTGAGVAVRQLRAGRSGGAGGPEPSGLRQRARRQLAAADPRRAGAADRPGRPARVADVGCGLGWAAIELARAFPHIEVDGYDADEESISAARRRCGGAPA